jgi:hypothetical protein
MPLKNSLIARLSADSSGQIPVVVEPDAWHTDDDVVALLERSGARRVRILTPRYISARVAVDSLDEIENVARVSLKHRKELHSPS